MNDLNDWQLRQLILLYRHRIADSDVKKYIFNQIQNDLTDIVENSKIQRLPADLWAIVLGRYGFMMANSLVRTCKLFYKAVYKEQFWHRAIEVMFRERQEVYAKNNDTYNNEKNHVHLSMILNYIKSSFFNQKINEKPINLFEYLRWIFDTNYFSIKFHEHGCSVHFRQTNRKSVLLYFVGYNDIKTMLRTKLKTSKWPVVYTDKVIDKISVHAHFPYDVNIKRAYLVVSNYSFVPQYLEYYDPEKKQLFCGIGYFNDDVLLRPNKKGRWFNVNDLLQNESLQNESLQNESLQNESLQNESL